MYFRYMCRLAHVRERAAALKFAEIEPVLVLCSSTQAGASCRRWETETQCQIPFMWKLVSMAVVCC